MKSKYLDSNIKNAIVSAFSQLPYKIVWKFEDDMFENLPKNVLISKWFPQQDVLRHPNVKLFITQGGSQSLEEAVAARVPLLAIPFIADQYANAERIATLGIGLRLSYSELTEVNFKESIEKIIKNSR